MTEKLFSLSHDVYLLSFLDRKCT